MATDMLMFCACEEAPEPMPVEAAEPPPAKSSAPPPPAYDVENAPAAANIPPPVMEVTAEPVVEKPSPARIPKSNEGLETFRQRLMNPGFVVTKYNFKSVLGGKKPRILYLDESSSKLGWKAPTGSAVSKAEKKGEMFALVDVTEVRAVHRPSPPPRPPRNPRRSSTLEPFPSRARL